MSNHTDKIGTQINCAECGEIELIVTLDEYGLPICFECATRDMPKGRVENDGMPLQTRSAQLYVGAEKRIQDGVCECILVMPWSIGDDGKCDYCGLPRPS